MIWFFMEILTEIKQMTDKIQIDISALEQGDTVVFRDGKRANVAHVNKRDYDTVLHLGFKNGTVSKIRYRFHGIAMYCGENYDIIEIIKNTKQWTDKDMAAACQLGIDVESNYRLKGCVIDFKKWLQQYKERKKKL